MWSDAFRDKFLSVLHAYVDDQHVIKQNLMRVLRRMWNGTVDKEDEEEEDDDDDVLFAASAMNSQGSQEVARRAYLTHAAISAVFLRVPKMISRTLDVVQSNLPRDFEIFQCDAKYCAVIERRRGKEAMATVSSVIALSHAPVPFMGSTSTLTPWLNTRYTVLGRSMSQRRKHQSFVCHVICFFFLVSILVSHTHTRL